MNAAVRLHRRLLGPVFAVEPPPRPVKIVEGPAGPPGPPGKCECGERWVTAADASFSLLLSRIERLEAARSDEPASAPIERRLSRIEDAVRQLNRDLGDLAGAVFPPIRP